MHLSKLWNIASEKGARVVVCTIPPIGLIYPPVQMSQSILNELITAECKASSNLIQVDLFNELSDSEGLLKQEYDSGDGLHLSVAGYQQMGHLQRDLYGPYVLLCRHLQPGYKQLEHIQGELHA